MHLTIENIGKIASASIEIDGITVIAGENDTGKSTVGKVLFSVFNSLHDIEAKMAEERIDSLDRALRPLSRQLFLIEGNHDEINSLAVHFVKHLSSLTSRSVVLDELKGLLSEDDFCHLDKDELGELADRVLEIAAITDEGIQKQVLSNRFRSEFNSQINNVYDKSGDSEGRIVLRIKNRQSTLSIRNNIVSAMDINHSLDSEVIYIDNPLVLNEISPIFGSARSFSHHSHLRKKLSKPKGDDNVVDEIIATNKVDSILRSLGELCDGDITRKGGRYNYRKRGTGADVDIRNISTGLKAFVIIKMLLENGSLQQNGTIVLDEPEIHLHPEWQLRFAEAIVLLQREFNMHILLTTHSPYFLHAIEVYAAKYSIANRCRYYQAVDHGTTATIEDVTNDIERIYAKLARPFQELENEAYAIA